MDTHAHAPAEHDMVGKEIEIEITGVAHPGMVVGRFDGKVVFTPDLIPGERALVRVVEDKGRFAYGEALSVIEQSPDRVAHIWPEASIERPPAQRAGGADYGHIELARQRLLKAEVLFDALKRIGKVDVPPQLADTAVQAAAGDDARGGLGWRTRVGLHVDQEGVVGPRARRSHRVIPVASLPLAHEALAARGLHRVRRPGASRIDLVLPADGEPVVVVDDGREPSVEPFREVLSESVLGHTFSVAADGFWQIHREAPETLTRAVLSLVDWPLVQGGRALDLYGGVGLFAVALAARGLAVTSVEGDALAAEHAAANLAGFTESRAVAVGTETFLAAQLRRSVDYRASLVVLDPPRTGAGRKVIDQLRELAPAQIIYVACDPVAFARDAGYLQRGGYTLTALEAHDLFPNTHHFEVVAAFTRAAHRTVR